MTPTNISTRATEMPSLIEITLATRANPIQADAPNHTCSIGAHNPSRASHPESQRAGESTLLTAHPGLIRSHQHRCGSGGMIPSRTAAMLMAPDEARVGGQECALSCPLALRMASTRRVVGADGTRVVRGVRLDGIGPGCQRYLDQARHFRGPGRNVRWGHRGELPRLSYDPVDRFPGHLWFWSPDLSGRCRD